KGSVEFADGLFVQGVQLLGPVHGNARDPALDGNGNVLVGHGFTIGWGRKARPERGSGRPDAARKEITPARACQRIRTEPPIEAQRPSGSGGYLANVTPTVNARPRAGNPFTSEYSRSSTFPTLSRSSAGTHAASETTAPRSREA